MSLVIIAAIWQYDHHLPMTAYIAVIMGMAHIIP